MKPWLHQDKTNPPDDVRRFVLLFRIAANVAVDFSRADASRRVHDQCSIDDREALLARTVQFLAAGFRTPASNPNQL